MFASFSDYAASADSVPLRDFEALMLPQVLNPFEAHPEKQSLHPFALCEARAARVLRHG